MNNLKEPQLEIIEFNSLPDNLILPLTSNQEKLKTSNWHSALQSKGKKFIDKKGNTNYTFVLNGFEPETNEKSNNYFDNLIIRNSKKEGISYFIVRYHPENNWLLESKDFQNFNGRLSFYGLKGNPLGATHLENGKSIAKSQNTKGGDGCNLTIYGGEPFCVGTVDGKLACWIYFDYSVSCGGGDGVDSYPDGSYDDPTNPDGGGTGGTGSSGGSTSGDEPDGLDEIDGGFVPDLPEEDAAAAIEENIDDSKLESCLKKILDSLQGHKHGVGKIIVEFAENDYSTFNWAVKSGNSTTATATATTDINYNTSTTTATTTFNASTFSNGTDISWARTFLHEAVHAYVISVSNASSLTFEERKELLGPNWIIAYINDGHDYIANTYVNSIADVLQEFGQLKGYTMDRQFYEDIAWGGLQGTNAFDNLSSTAQNRILDLIAIELTGKDRNGNHKTQKGTVAGC